MSKPLGHAQTAQPSDNIWGEALRRWYEQEQTDLPPPDEGIEAEYDRPFPPGWWILPGLVLSLALWGVIIWMVLT